MCYKRNFFVLALTICSLQAIAETSKLNVGANREWVKTAVQDKLNQGQLDAAITLLQEHLRTDSKDAESWGRLALLQSRTSRCNDAIDALTKASAASPPNTRDSYLIASEHLKTNGCKSLSPSLSNTESASADLKSSVRLRLGHDNNVMLLSDAVTSTDSPESAFINPLALISYKRSLGAGKLDLNSTTSYTAYTESAVDIYNSIYQSFGAEWEPSSLWWDTWQARIGNRFDLSFVNSDGMRFFSWTDTIYASIARELSTNSKMGFEVPVGFQKFAEETAVTSNDNRDGAVITPAVWYALKQEKYVWQSALNFSQVFASGENYRSQAYGASTGFSGNVTDLVRGRIQVSFAQTNYFDNSNGRKDDRFDATAGAAYSPISNSNLNFALDLFVTNNNSNISGATYKRNTVMGQVEYAF